MTTDKLIAQIEHEISLNGGNRHKYPFTFGKAGGKWSVIIEINSTKRTFDIETEDTTLPTALMKALTQLRASYSNVR